MKPVRHLARRKCHVAARAVFAAMRPRAHHALPNPRPRRRRSRFADGVTHWQPVQVGRLRGFAFVLGQAKLDREHLV